MMANKWDELGSSGLSVFAGYIAETYHTKLEWPTCWPLYSRIWRSDPETTVIRNLFDAWAGGLTVGWELPEAEALGPPSDDDKRALEFAHSVLDEIEDGINRWLTSCMARVPFMGWGFWEAPPGLRKQGWRPPGGDPWRSESDDGLIGYRRLAFRSYSSFARWDMDEPSGRVNGFVQYDRPNPEVTIPVDRSLHIRYGDLDNPEGLATLEALWRLERIKYGLEMVQGIGFEHTAGHAVFTVQEQLTEDAKAAIKAGARAVMTAQEGNYVTEVEGKFKFRLEDSNFEAASAILDAIRYYGIMKLSLLGMQWVALSATTGAGSYASMSDSSGMAVLLFNSMAQGCIDQADRQIGKRLFDFPVNKQAFPGMTRRPVMKVSQIEKGIDLGNLAQFLAAFGALLPLGDDDIIAVREASGILPETLPEEDRRPQPEPDPEPEPEAEGDDSLEPDGTPADEEDADLAKRPFMVAPDEKAIDVTPMADDMSEGLDRAVRRFETWAKKNEPMLAELLNAEAMPEDEANED